MKSKKIGQIIWIFGRPSSGKSTLAKSVKAWLDSRDVACCILDGDQTRGWLTPDCGFSPSDRLKNIERTLHVAQLLADNGIIVICAYVTPTHKCQKRVDGYKNTRMVYITTPLEMCRARDAKGLYARGAADIEYFDEPKVPVLRLLPKSVVEWTQEITDQAWT